MNTVGKITLGALAGIGLVVAGVAVAHNAGMEHGYGMGHHPAGMGPCVKGDSTEHLASVKEQLKLTPDQTEAWQAFETAVRSQTEGLSGTHPHSMAGTDGMETHIAFMEQRLEGMKKILQARNDLYATLTPEQKATADKLLQPGSHFGPHH